MRSVCSGAVLSSLPTVLVTTTTTTTEKTPGGDPWVQSPAAATPWSMLQPCFGPPSDPALGDGARAAVEARVPGGAPLARLRGPPRTVSNIHKKYSSCHCTVGSAGPTRLHHGTGTRTEGIEMTHTCANEAMRRTRGRRARCRRSAKCAQRPQHPRRRSRPPSPHARAHCTACRNVARGGQA